MNKHLKVNPTTLWRTLTAVATCSLTSIAAHATEDLSDWYVFTPGNDYSVASAIGMEDWNAEAAGKHGRIRMKDDKLFYNGEEIKLWGLNNSYINCAPPKDMAKKRAAFYRKFGINAMRLHKYADGSDWAGILTDDSFVNFEAEDLDRMDYYIHTLAEHGIYTKLSPTFGVKVAKAEFDRVPFIEELGNERRNRIRASYGSIYLSREIQDLQIEQTINILNHTNPYSGLRYAEDPAIFCVEMFNEDSVLFSGTNRTLQDSPTLRNRTARGFSQWLEQKYGSEAAWRTAWGAEAVIDNPENIPNNHLRNLVEPDKVKGDIRPESLAAGTVVPWASPWFNDAAVRPGTEQAFLKQRLLDSMRYLGTLQIEFYDRFYDAIRATDFEGEIIASNWQAGSLVGHFINLFSDYRIGMIDRHNYFGGGSGRALRGEDNFIAGSMLAHPGMGTLSAGFQQVDNRAFMLSEWIHEQPNEWYAEGPAILGAYGWGLQGWDVSYIFQNGDEGEFSNRLLRERWDVTNPAVIGIYSAVSRHVRRMDVSEAPETKALNVHVPSLFDGKLSFQNQTLQSWDTKSFTTDKAPMETLAVTRVAVDFVDEYTETPAFDLEAHKEDGAFVSTTEQLRWTPAPEGEQVGGYFTMNTPGTKAFVGFAPGGKTFDLGDGYSITPAAGFALIYLSAKNEDETLETARDIIVTAMARARNTGMQLNEAGNRIVERGDSPIVLEPVRAEVSTPFAGTLFVLDQDGALPTSNRPVKQAFSIDGSTDKTPYYLIRKADVSE